MPATSPRWPYILHTYPSSCWRSSPFTTSCNFRQFTPASSSFTVDTLSPWEWGLPFWVLGVLSSDAVHKPGSSKDQQPQVKSWWGLLGGEVALLCQRGRRVGLSLMGWFRGPGSSEFWAWFASTISCGSPGGDCQGCIISFLCSFASLADFELISSTVCRAVALWDKGLIRASLEALCFSVFAWLTCSYLSSSPR